MNINYDTLSIMMKYGLIMTGILLLVFLLAAVTPKLAKFADKILGRVKNPLTADNKDESVPFNEVHSVYDGSKPITESENDNENKK